MVRRSGIRKKLLATHSAIVLQPICLKLGKTFVLFKSCSDMSMFPRLCSTLMSAYLEAAACGALSICFEIRSFPTARNSCNRISISSVVGKQSHNSCSRFVGLNFDFFAKSGSASPRFQNEFDGFGNYHLQSMVAICFGPNRSSFLLSRSQSPSATCHELAF